MVFTNFYENSMSEKDLNQDKDDTRKEPQAFEGRRAEPITLSTCRSLGIFLFPEDNVAHRWWCCWSCDIPRISHPMISSTSKFSSQRIPLPRLLLFHIVCSGSLPLFPLTERLTPFFHLCQNHFVVLRGDFRIAVDILRATLRCQVNHSHVHEAIYSASSY